MFEMKKKKPKLALFFLKTYLDGIPSKVVLGSSRAWWAWAPKKKKKK
jgi:hypothetical protein